MSDWHGIYFTPPPFYGMGIKFWSPGSIWSRCLAGKSQRGLVARRVCHEVPAVVTWIMFLGTSTALNTARYLLTQLVHRGPLRGITQASVCLNFISQQARHHFAGYSFWLMLWSPRWVNFISQWICLYGTRAYFNTELPTQCLRNWKILYSEDSIFLMSARSWNTNAKNTKMGENCQTSQKGTI